MENCRAKRISGARAAAGVASAVPAATGNHKTNRAMRTGILSPPWYVLLARLRSETGIILARHDSHAPHVARLIRAIVGHRVMHGADVVPHQHLPLRPLVGVEVFGLLLVREQELQQL